MSLTTNKIAAAAMIIRITMSNEYADCIDVLLFKQDNAQPVALAVV